MSINLFVAKSIRHRLKRIGKQQIDVNAMWTLFREWDRTHRCKNETTLRTLKPSSLTATSQVASSFGAFDIGQHTQQINEGRDVFLSIIKTFSMSLSWYCLCGHIVFHSLILRIIRKSDPIKWTCAHTNLLAWLALFFLN